MIRYMPELDSYLWAKKSLVYFDTLEDLKRYIADQRTRFCRFIGRPEKSFLPDDVNLTPTCTDPLTCLRNYRGVMIDGITVGFCGE